MFRLIFAFALMMGVVFGLMAAPASAQDGHDLRIVIIRDLNLYADADLDAEVLTVIPEGTELYYQHNVSGDGFMFMTYDGENGWIELDGFVSYDEYYGTDDGTDDGTDNVGTLPTTGAGAPVATSPSLPLLSALLLGLIGVAAFSLRPRPTR